MISLVDFNTYFQGMANVDTGVKRVDVVPGEDNIKDILSDISNDDMPFLIAVIPSGKSNGSEQNNVVEVNYSLFYVLIKTDAVSKTDMEIMLETQPVVEAVKQQMMDDKELCGVMRDLDVGSFHMDPEWRFLGKCTGWSVSFEF